MSKSITEPSTNSSEPSIDMKVVEAIADAEDVTITELDPMYEYVDLDALETLVLSSDDDLSIQWTMNGHRIEVDGTGTVHVK